MTAGPWVLGLVGASMAPGMPSALAVFARAVRSAVSLPDVLRAAQRAFIDVVAPALGRAASYPTFRELFADTGGSAIALYLAGQEESGSLALGAFGATITSFDPLSFQMFGGPLGWADRPFFHADGQEAAIALVQQRPSWLTVTAGAARRVIETQISATPDVVAGPIHVLEITADGIRKECG